MLRVDLPVLHFELVLSGARPTRIEYFLCERFAGDAEALGLGRAILRAAHRAHASGVRWRFAPKYVTALQHGGLGLVRCLASMKLHLAVNPAGNGCRCFDTPTVVRTADAR